MTWPTKKLSDVCILQNGFAFKSSEYVSTGYFVMRIANVQDGYISQADPKYIDTQRENEFSRFILNAGDILISLTGNVGRVGIVEHYHLPAVLNQRVARIKPTEPIDNKYLYFLLLSPYFIEKVIGKGHGMAQMNVSTRDIENFEIPIPPLEVQEKIVKKIEELFAKITQAQSLRESAIQDTNNLIPATLSKIFEEGRLKGWEEKKLGEICQIARGGSPRPIKEYLTSSEDGINWIKISDATNSTKYIYKTKEKIKKEGFKKTRLVKPGDFILTNSMSFGHPYIMKTSGAIHDGWLLLRPIEKIYSEYLYYFLGSDRIYNEFRNLAGGAVVKNLNSELVKSVRILIPSFSEQKEIVERMDALTQKVRELQKLQSETAVNLTALKQSILHKAFQGELIN